LASSTPASSKAPSTPPPPETGGLIVFGRWDPKVGDQVIYGVDPDGSHLHQISKGAAEVPKLSPDGSQVLSVSGVTWNVDGTGIRHLPPIPGFAKTTIVGCSAWSPDGSRIACEVISDEKPQIAGLYTRLASNGGDLERVTTNPGAEDDPGDYSPDGSMISFVRYDPSRSEDDNTAVFTVGIDGQGLRRISPWAPFHDLTSSWSPDGHWILFDQNDRIYKVHPDGTELARIAPRVADRAFAHAWYPAWSPDGRWIVFTMSLPDSYGNNLYTMRPDGTDVRQLTRALAGSQEQGEGDEYPDWGPSSSP
jgi:Tol biopolymer transport system component